jgi:hypothetical protein
MDVSAEVGAFDGTTHHAVVPDVVAVPTIYGRTITLRAETLLPHRALHGWLRSVTVDGAFIPFVTPKAIHSGDTLNIDFR